MSLSAANSLPLQVERTKKREPTMPIAKYFGGHGSEVMADMKKKNGEKGGEREFYATANAKGQKPDDKTKRKSIGQRMVERSGY